MSGGWNSTRMTGGKRGNIGHVGGIQSDFGYSKTWRLRGAHSGHRLHQSGRRPSPGTGARVDQIEYLEQSGFFTATLRGCKEILQCALWLDSHATDKSFCLRMQKPCALGAVGVNDKVCVPLMFLIYRYTLRQDSMPSPDSSMNDFEKH